MTTAPKNMTDAIIRDVTLYSGGQWLTGHDVVVSNGVVESIEKSTGTATPGSVDGSGGAYLIPGFVNTHTHLQQSLMRGIAEGTPLLEWLLAVAEESVQITPERAYTATVAASLEALRSGTTTLVEHMWPHPSSEVHDAVIRALHDTGIRAVLGRGTADRADKTRKWGLRSAAHATTRRRSRTYGSDDARRRRFRVDVAVAVPNPRSLTPDGMSEVREFAQARDLTVSIHLLETQTDNTMCTEHAGMNAVDYLDSHGFLWDRVLAVHCVELDDRGQKVLAERGVGVSYNPVSNMRLGSGIAPVPSFLDAGDRGGVGCGRRSQQRYSGHARDAAHRRYVQRAARGRADLLGFEAMIDIASGGANAALGLPARSGGISVGDPADLTMIRFERDFGCLPVRDPGASILTTGSRQIVDTVLVAGEVVLRDGHSTRVDEAELIRTLSAL